MGSVHGASFDSLANPRKVELLGRLGHIREHVSGGLFGPSANAVLGTFEYAHWSR